jgi:hypothetical protein
MKGTKEEGETKKSAGKRKMLWRRLRIVGKEDRKKDNIGKMYNRSSTLEAVSAIILMCRDICSVYLLKCIYL